MASSGLMSVEFAKSLVYEDLSWIATANALIKVLICRPYSLVDLYLIIENRSWSLSEEDELLEASSGSW